MSRFNWLKIWLITNLGYLRVENRSPEREKEKLRERERDRQTDRKKDTIVTNVTLNYRLILDSIVKSMP